MQNLWVFIDFLADVTILLVSISFMFNLGWFTIEFGVGIILLRLLGVSKIVEKL